MRNVRPNRLRSIGLRSDDSGRLSSYTHVWFVSSDYFAKVGLFWLTVTTLEQRFDMSSDQPCTPLIAQIEPRPLDDHYEAAAKANQVKNVYAQPCQPRGEARQFEWSELGNRGAPADAGERAPIHIMKW